MEELREILNKYIMIYGALDKRTLKISQKLDKFINEEMKKKKQSKRILCKGFN